MRGHRFAVDHAIMYVAGLSAFRRLSFPTYVSRIAMTGIDLVIFDCDGVLIDSEIIASRVEAELLTQAGFPISAEELAETYAGLTFRDILLRIEEKAEIPLQSSLLDKAERLTDQHLKTEVTAIEGAHQAVAAVTAARCVCSNSSMSRLDTTLTRTRLKAYFEGRIFSVSDTKAGRPKPAPDIFLHAATVMKAQPQRSFVIEDSIYGVQGARAAGMRVIGFTGGSHSYPGHADLLTDAGAETVIHRLADLKGVLAALSQWSEA